MGSGYVIPIPFLAARVPESQSPFRAGGCLALKLTELENQQPVAKPGFPRFSGLDQGSLSRPMNELLL